MKAVSRQVIGSLRARQHFLDTDRRQMVLVIVCATTGLLLSIKNDVVLLKGTSILPVMLGVRGVHLIITLGVLQQLRVGVTLRKFERLVATWNLVSLLPLLGIGLSRIPVREFQGPFVGFVATVCIYYFATRGFIFSRIAASFSISALMIMRLLQPQTDVSSAARTTGIVLLLVVNTMGIYAARTFELQRANRHDAERHEKRARSELANKNRELEAQKAKAETMYRARTAFLAAMSHEFRTPMNAVIGLSDLLVNAPIAPEYREHARTIRTSATALLGLLNDVLDFAKIDAGKLTLSPAPFHLRRLLDSIVEMMQPAAAAKNIVLKTQFSSNLPDYVVGDDARLRQVVVNLLSNALKFTSQGSVTFTVTSTPLDTPTHEIGFAVEDTGIGMSPDVLSRLFRPFEQGEGGIERRYGGTGLGLVISQQIVNVMGGQIGVASQAGKGSRFAFRIVLPQAESQGPAEVENTQNAQQPVQALAILVVDDVAVNRTVARVMLQSLGHKADFAEDGLRAIEAVMSKNYDVVLMDLQMPNMGGIETTKVIREKLVDRPMPKIVAMSASVFEEDREACRAVGMVDFVAKPIELDKLRATLTHIANRKGAPSSGIFAAPKID